MILTKMRMTTSRIRRGRAHFWPCYVEFSLGQPSGNVKVDSWMDMNLGFREKV
jgi:hypothetical protein